MTRRVLLLGFIPLLTIEDDGEEWADSDSEAPESDEQDASEGECHWCHSRRSDCREGSVTSERHDSVGFVGQLPDDLPIQHRRETWDE